MLANASRTIKSAHRVLEILEYFDQERRHVTVMDMSRALKYPQSSTSELLRCLARLGYLHYNRYRRTYSPTARVALMGAWVKPSLFRGGPVLSAIDQVARVTNETVILSTISNYVVQHLHVIHGNSADAVDAHGGDTRSMLHSPQGRLALSSYRNEHIRSALHRLNAEESNPSKHVKVAELISDFAVLRERGWVIEQEADGTGCAAVMLPVRRGTDRLVMSVQAPADVITQRGEEFLQLLFEQRDKIGTLDYSEIEESRASNVVQLARSGPILDHRRFA